MNLITKANNDTRIITIPGNIDLYNAMEFSEFIDHLSESGVTSMILSFKNVSYIDSSGMGSLLHIMRTAWILKIRIAFTDISRPVMRLIEFPGLRDYFPIAESMEEALSMIRINGGI